MTRAQPGRDPNAPLQGYGHPLRELTAELLHERLAYDPVTGQFRWRLDTGPRAKAGHAAGTPCKAGYLNIKLMGRTYKTHRLAWLYVHGEWPRGSLDHRDGIRTNNAIDNLREATPAQNAANNRIYSSNRSGFKGVTQDQESGRWRASIKVGGRQQWLGTFDSPQEAHAAYVAAANAAFGEFARSA